MEFIQPADAQAKLSQGGVLLVDIRSDAEYEAGHIPGAVLIPDAQLDSAAARLLNPRETIFYCSSGMRTRASAPILAKAGFGNATCIDGGLQSWRLNGLPVTAGNAGMATMNVARQVQLTVGILLIVLTALAVLVSPLFVFGAAAIGLGLAIAGLTGSCTMARILMAMPWNQSNKKQNPGGQHAHS